MFVVKRSEHNPILTPYREHHFEASRFSTCRWSKSDGNMSVCIAHVFPDRCKIRDKFPPSAARKARRIHFEIARFSLSRKRVGKVRLRGPARDFFETILYFLHRARRISFCADNIKTAVGFRRPQNNHRATSRHAFNSKA